MSTHSAYDAFNFHSLRATLHMGAPPVSLRPARPLGSTAPVDWLERLAIWAERQPAHHRMGSYTQLR
jgi:hypothetical protein